MIVEHPVTLQQIWGLETKSSDSNAFIRTGHFGDAFLITSLLLFQYLLCAMNAWGHGCVQDKYGLWSQ